MRFGVTRNAAGCGSLWMVLRTAALTSAALFTLSAASAQVGGGAQNQGISARFPEPSQVMADFHDDPSRYAALTALFNVVQQKTPGPSPGAYQKSAAYSRAMGELANKYAVRGANQQASRKFQERARQLIVDQTFRRSVLEKYGVADLPVEPRRGGVLQRGIAPAPIAGPRPVIDENQLLLAAAPYWIATLIGMAFVPRLVLTMTGKLASSSPPGMDAYRGPLELPDALRAFQVLGQRYAVEMQSGKVIEEKTWSETHTSVVSTPASYQVMGDQVYQTGGGTTVSSTAVTKDRIWVRTLDGGETAWNFSGGGFVVRQGHIVTGILRPLGNGTSDFLLAYNHTTGQLQTYHPSNPSDKIRIFLPWAVTTLLGTAGFILGVSEIFQLRMGQAGLSLAGGLQSLAAAVGVSGGGCLFGAAITARILAGFSRGRVRRQRDRRFEQQFQPAFLKFLQQATLTLVQRLGKP